MVRESKSEKVPKSIKPTFDAIVELTNSFCKEHLNEEYAQLARQVTAALCRKRPSPLMSGRANSWACGIIYALTLMRQSNLKVNTKWQKQANAQFQNQ